MSVSLRLQGSAHELKLSAEKELGRIIEAVDRLRESAITNLSEDHPCTLEIEDFAWHAKRFSHGLVKKLSDT
jgi:hypothetical protein